MGPLANRRGQASLEAMVSAGAIIAFLFALLFLIYFLWLHNHLRLVSHEYLVCQEFHEPSGCKTKFKKHLGIAHRFGSMLPYQEFKTATSNKIQIPFRIGGVKWTFKDSIALPLQP